MIRISPISKLIPPVGNPNGLTTIFRQISTAAFPLHVKATTPLWAEPMKAKKRVDPAILRLREERRKKKIEKQIRKLEKLTKPLKPIEELLVPLCLVQDKKSREREVEVSAAFREKRIRTFKEWSNYGNEQSKRDVKLLDRLMYSQKMALDELRLESEELYQAAVKIDQNLIPFKYDGPVETLPSMDYSTPDGDYIDISRKWD